MYDFGIRWRTYILLIEIVLEHLGVLVRSLKSGGATHGKVAGVLRQDGIIVRLELGDSESAEAGRRSE